MDFLDLARILTLGLHQPEIPTLGHHNRAGVDNGRKLGSLSQREGWGLGPHKVVSVNPIPFGAVGGP